MRDPVPIDTSLSDEDFHIVQDILSRRVGIALTDDKQYLVVNRLTPLLRSYEIASLHALIQTLQFGSNPALWDEVVDVLAVHETSFFRDEAPFRQLQQEILPEICRQAQNSGRTIQIWSAGCSTGQEAYSIAMLIMEIAPQLAQRVRILGSDVSSKVLQSAQGGRYRKFEVGRGLSETRLKQFFQPSGDSWQAVDSLRSMTHWQKFSLAGSWPALPQFDLVLIRNVMVYFDITVRDSLIRKMHRQLNRGGRLVVGSAESLMALHHSFRPVTSHGATHYIAQ